MPSTIDRAKAFSARTRTTRAARRRRPLPPDTTRSSSAFAPSASTAASSRSCACAATAGGPGRTSSGEVVALGPGVDGPAVGTRLVALTARRERWWRDVETLVTPQDLAEWVVCARLLASQPSVDDALLAAARDLREAIDTAVCALSEPDGPPHVVLAAIDGWLPEALVPDRLCADVGRPPVLVPGIAANLGRYALGLLVLRRCSGPSSATAFASAPRRPAARGSTAGRAAAAGAGAPCRAAATWPRHDGIARVRFRADERPRAPAVVFGAMSPYSWLAAERIAVLGR